MAAACVDHTKVLDIIKKNGGLKSELIAILQDIQEEYNYLPADALRHVAKELGMREIDILGVASFYKSFSLTPRGRHLINVCLGTACHVRGAPRILSEIERKLGIPAGETTSDGFCTLTTVNCVGACALGPIVIVDSEYHGQMKIDKAGKLVTKMSKQHRKGN
jgi:NADH:ubiquinone oxidoreductase subunit E